MMAVRPSTDQDATLVRVAKPLAPACPDAVTIGVS